MNTSKIIRAVVGGRRYIETAAITKEDYGRILKIEGIELPETYEIDFSNDQKEGTSVTMIGNADGVLIPQQFIKSGKDIYAFYYHVGEDYGKTTYIFHIPNRVRPDRTNETPEPEQQSVIDQAIAVLNTAVAQTAQDVVDADASAQSAAESAENAAQSASQAAESAQNAHTYALSANVASGTASNFAEVSQAYASQAQTSAQTASEKAAQASSAESAAASAAQTATAKAIEAAQIVEGVEGYAESAAQSASSAATSATTASTKASESSASASTASTKATEATTAATTATTAKDDAVSAKNAAETAQAAAETAQEAAEDAAESVSASAAQIATNTADITGLKEDLNDRPKTLTPEDGEADLYICDVDGNVLAKFEGGHIKTKNFDSSNVGNNMIQEASETEADLYICDSFGNVIAEFKDGHIVTKYFDSADYTDVLGDVSELQSDVTTLEGKTTGILYRTKAFDDGVYAACKYKTASNRQFCMLIAGDCHANYPAPRSLIEYLNANEAVDCAVMLGDIVGNVFGNSIDHWTEALSISEKPVLTAMGNHDVRGASSDTDLWNRYGVFLHYADLAEDEAVEGKYYYYKDFATQKIRVIVLMQYDYVYTGELCFGQAQINWLIGVLNSTPLDYAVIICEHTNPSRYMAYNMDTAYTSNTWKRTNYAPTVMDGDPVPDIVDAWINGTTLSQSYSYTYENPPADLVVTADFTERGAGEFISYFGGHWHCNLLGNVADHDDQMDFHPQACSTGTDAVSGDIPRKVGTMSEDSFCAIAVDRDKKLVKVFQVGAHFTNYGTSRQYFAYSYGGSNT